MTVLLCIIICSCIRIPYNARTTEVCRVGERYSSDGKLVSYIDKRAKQNDYYVIMGPDGGFKNTRSEYYNYFMINEDNSEASLSFLDEYAGIKQYVEPILPIENTDYWITFWEARDKTYLKDILNIEFDNFDYILFIVVFDKNGIIYNQYVPEVKWNKTNRPSAYGEKKCGHQRFPKLDRYYLEATEGNHTIKFKTERGDYVYHVDGNILEKSN
jgi:hypothetical protein